MFQSVSIRKIASASLAAILVGCVFLNSAMASSTANVATTNDEAEAQSSQSQTDSANEAAASMAMVGEIVGMDTNEDMTAVGITLPGDTVTFRVPMGENGRYLHFAFMHAASGSRGWYFAPKSAYGISLSPSMFAGDGVVDITRQIGLFAAPNASTSRTVSGNEGMLQYGASNLYMKATVSIVEDMYEVKIENISSGPYATPFSSGVWQVESARMTGFDHTASAALSTLATMGKRADLYAKVRGEEAMVVTSAASAGQIIGTDTNEDKTALDITKPGDSVTFDLPVSSGDQYLHFAFMHAASGGKGWYFAPRSQDGILISKSMFDNGNSMDITDQIDLFAAPDAATSTAVRQNDGELRYGAASRFMRAVVSMDGDMYAITIENLSSGDYATPFSAGVWKTTDSKARDFDHTASSALSALATMGQRTALYNQVVAGFTVGEIIGKDSNADMTAVDITLPGDAVTFAIPVGEGEQYLHFAFMHAASGSKGWYFAPQSENGISIARSMFAGGAVNITEQIALFAAPDESTSTAITGNDGEDLRYGPAERFMRATVTMNGNMYEVKIENLSSGVYATPFSSGVWQVIGTRAPGFDHAPSAALSKLATMGQRADLFEQVQSEVK